MEQVAVAIRWGPIALSVVLVVGFSIALPAIHRWGATDEEVTRALPGDELLAKPIVNWTTATTINARPDQVWPWSRRSAIRAAASTATPSSRTRLVRC